jgi:hypothetical protein
MKKEKYVHNKEQSLKKDVIFCSECGEELEMFGISEVDVEKVRARHKHCREVGRFKGDKCAMLFIADSIEFDFPENEED